MSKLTREVRQSVRELTVSTLIELLRFRLSRDIAQLLLDKSAGRCHEIEMELHEDYPLKAAGIIATPSLVRNWSRKINTILHTDEALAPEDASWEVHTFPLDATAIVYLFSWLEDYGNTLAKFVKPGQKFERRAWHAGVYADANIIDKQTQKKMQAAFAECFNFASSDVSTEILAGLVELKKIRNEVVHEKRLLAPFARAFELASVTICHLHFLVLEKDKGLRIFPWQDLEGKFQNPYWRRLRVARQGKA